MDFGEFLTYCTIKDYIVSHERLDDEWVADKVNKHKLVIENAKFLATITYIHFAGKHTALYTELKTVHATYDKTIVDADIDLIISKFA